MIPLARHCGSVPATYGSESSLVERGSSKISAHHAKAGYDYPTIRLPFTFSGLIGMSTRIYQTVQEGALAFLVVISSSNKSAEESPRKSENPTICLRPPYLHGEGRAFESPSAKASLIARVGVLNFRDSRNPSLF
jgi:hypothetical protein